MDNKLQFKSKYTDIKSIKFYKNGKVKREKYFNGTIVEYNKNGEEVYYKGGTFGNEYWKVYDENNKCIYYKINDKVIFDKRKNKGE